MTATFYLASQDFLQIFYLCTKLGPQFLDTGNTGIFLSTFIDMLLKKINYTPYCLKQFTSSPNLRFLKQSSQLKVKFYLQLIIKDRQIQNPNQFVWKPNLGFPLEKITFLKTSSLYKNMCVLDRQSELLA